MATINLYVGMSYLDHFESLNLDDVALNSATKTQIQASVDYLKVNIFGTFTYSGSYLSGGTVSGFNLLESGKKLAEVSNVSIGIRSLLTYDIDQLVENVLAGDDIYHGSTDIDLLEGFGGNDKIYGYAGNDTIDGGSGADIMTGGLGSDTYFVDNVSDKVIETGGTSGGIDTVHASASWIMPGSVEKLILKGTTAIHGTGDNTANTITGNTGANNLSGLGGNDILNGGAGNDILNGGTGTDTMTGGLGDDTYFVDQNGDKTIEGSGSGTGTDTVKSSITWILGANVENLILTGTTALNGTGNTLANTLTGNSGANILNGLAGADKLVGNGGNDILNGGLGKDILTGSAGKDVFLFNTVLGSANVDKITDFSVVDDTIKLSHGTFAKLAISSPLNSGRFRSSIDGTAADANDYILYNTQTGALLYDVDGNGTGVAVQFATLGNKPQNVTAADFVVVA